MRIRSGFGGKPDFPVEEDPWAKLIHDYIVKSGFDKIFGKKTDEHIEEPCKKKVKFIIGKNLRF